VAVPLRRDARVPDELPERHEIHSLSSAKTSANGKLHKDWCKFELFVAHGERFFPIEEARPEYQRQPEALR
jgi:hypothetical protein